MNLTMEAFQHGVTPPAARTLATYGLTQDEWIALLKEQGWVCPICQLGNDRPRSGKQALWNTDHEHVPGWAKLPPEERKRHVRGVLCYHCNHRKVSNHRDPDEVQRIADYLRRHRERMAS
jgi:hypothetical protein